MLYLYIVHEIMFAASLKMYDYSNLSPILRNLRRSKFVTSSMKNITSGQFASTNLQRNIFGIMSILWDDRVR